MASPEQEFEHSPESESNVAAFFQNVKGVEFVPVESPGGGLLAGRGAVEEEVPLVLEQISENREVESPPTDAVSSSRASRPQLRPSAQTVPGDIDREGLRTALIRGICEFEASMAHDLESRSSSPETQTTPVNSSGEPEVASTTVGVSVRPNRQTVTAAFERGPEVQTLSRREKHVVEAARKLIESPTVLPKHSRPTAITDGGARQNPISNPTRAEYMLREVDLLLEEGGEKGKDLRVSAGESTTDLVESNSLARALDWALSGKFIDAPRTREFPEQLRCLADIGCPVDGNSRGFTFRVCTSGPEFQLPGGLVALPVLPEVERVDLSVHRPLGTRVGTRPADPLIPYVKDPMELSPEMKERLENRRQKILEGLMGDVLAGAHETVLGPVGVGIQTESTSMYSSLRSTTHRNLPAGVWMRELSRIGSSEIGKVSITEAGGGRLFPHSSPWKYERERTDVLGVSVEGKSFSFRQERLTGAQLAYEIERVANERVEKIAKRIKTGIEAYVRTLAYELPRGQEEYGMNVARAAMSSFLLRILKEYEGAITIPYEQVCTDGMTLRPGLNSRNP